MIIDGKIKLAHGNVREITETAVVLQDGTVLPADVIVYATGYGSMNGWAADLIGQDVADKVGKCWGLGSAATKDPGPWVGELRNMWKPTQQNGLWFHGGNPHQSRHYSQVLSLQLKARMEGIPTPVYGIPETYEADLVPYAAPARPVAIRRGPAESPAGRRGSCHEEIGRVDDRVADQVGYQDCGSGP